MGMTILYHQRVYNYARAILWLHFPYTTTILYHHGVDGYTILWLYYGYTIFHYTMATTVLHRHSVFDYVLYYGYTMAIL